VTVVARELPMFPLGTVLFPGTALPLHVFEPRYRAMTGYCLEHEGRMGIVLIARGSEVGGGDVRNDVGTEARIVEAAALPDGRWILVLVGERRIRVQRWLPEEPYPRAEVVTLEDPDAGPATAADALIARDGLIERIGKALALKTELGEWSGDEPVPDLAADPALATWQAAGLGLIGPADGQRLLETDGVDNRLRLLASLLDEEIAVLALRAAGG
jgi:Lon protease-like protein